VQSADVFRIEQRMMTAGNFKNLNVRASTPPRNVIAFSEVGPTKHDTTLIFQLLTTFMAYRSGATLTAYVKS